MFSFRILPLFVFLFAQYATADLQPGSCPRDIVIRGAHLPSDKKIEEAFTHVTGSYENQHADVRRFVHGLALAKHMHVIKLNPTAKNGFCGGTVSGLHYKVAIFKSDTNSKAAPLQAEIWVENEQPVPGDIISMGLVNHKLVGRHKLVGPGLTSFLVSLPSNCSNCSHSADLFKIDEIEVHD